jgi:hypothetical protein
VARASVSQCRSRKCPEFDPSPVSSDTEKSEGQGDVAVLEKVLKKKCLRILFMFIFDVYLLFCTMCGASLSVYNFSRVPHTQKTGRGGGGGGRGAAKSSCRILARVGKKTLELGQKAVVFLWRKASLTRGSNYRNWEHKGHREII